MIIYIYITKTNNLHVYVTAITEMQNQYLVIVSLLSAFSAGVFSSDRLTLIFF